METKQEGNGAVQDLYFEHSQHFTKTEQCSECFKMSEVDFTNKTINNTLSTLRERIEEQRKLREQAHNLVKIEMPLLEVKDLPVLDIFEKEEFNTERFDVLCSRANVFYHNFLVAEQNCKNEKAESVCDFINAIKELSKGIDEVVDESTKVRFS